MPQEKLLVDQQPQVLHMVTAPVIQQFIDLEKDAKYKMMLLNVRESEIERCTKAYEDLQITLKCCLKTNLKLKERIAHLERALSSDDEDKLKEIESYKKQISILNKTFTELKRDYDMRLHVLDNDSKRKILETDHMYAEKLNSKETEFEKQLEEVNVKLQRELFLNSKLKSNLETVMNANIGLKCQVDHLKRQSCLDKSTFEIELNELKVRNKTLSCDVLRLRQEIDKTADQNANFKQAIAKYEAKIQCDEARLNEITQKNKKYKHINDKLNSELWECKHRNKEVATRFEEVLEEGNRMREEIERLRVINNVTAPRMRCNIPEHENHEQLTRQNTVLQEIVKTMRRERNDNKECEKLRTAEGRIEKLEGVIEDFKKGTFFKAISLCSAHCGDM